MNPAIITRLDMTLAAPEIFILSAACIILLIDLLIITEQPAILLPIAIISTLGVLSLLIIVFSMMWAMIMRQDNTADKLIQLWMPFLAGTTLAFLMITVIDLLRFKLTGTWGGFPLG